MTLIKCFTFWLIKKWSGSGTSRPLSNELFCSLLFYYSEDKSGLPNRAVKANHQQKIPSNK